MRSSARGVALFAALSLACAGWSQQHIYILPNMRAATAISNNLDVDGAGPLVFNAFSTVSGMRFVLEANGSFITLQQSVDIWDFQSSSYTGAISSKVTTSDSQAQAEIRNPNRFIEPGTGLMRARIRVRPNGPVLNNVWSLKIDQAGWRVRP